MAIILGCLVVLISVLGWRDAVRNRNRYIREDENYCKAIVLQLYAAAALYGENHDGRYPGHDNWQKEIQKFLYEPERNWFVCPGARCLRSKTNLDSEEAVVDYVLVPWPTNKSFEKFDKRQRAGLLLIFESAANHKNKRTICDVDGRVEMAEEQEFQTKLVATKAALKQMGIEFDWVEGPRAQLPPKD